jgi:hypothetical protein
MRTPTPGEPSTFERVEVELDARLLAVWLQAWEVDEWDLAIVGPFLRLAYGAGYRDGLTEHPRGALYRVLGQRIPRRDTL